MNTLDEFDDDYDEDINQGEKEDEDLQILVEHYSRRIVVSSTAKKQLNSGKKTAAASSSRQQKSSANSQIKQQQQQQQQQRTVVKKLNDLDDFSPDLSLASSSSLDSASSSSEAADCVTYYSSPVPPTLTRLGYNLDRPFSAQQSVAVNLLLFYSFF